MLDGIIVINQSYMVSQQPACHARVAACGPCMDARGLWADPLLKGTGRRAMPMLAESLGSSEDLAPRGTTRRG